MPVCKSNEFIYLPSLSSPQGENIVNVSFPLKRFSLAEVQYFCLDCRHKDVGKGDCHLCTDGKALQEIGVHYTVHLCVSARLLRPLYTICCHTLVSWGQCDKPWGSLIYGDTYIREIST